MQVCVVVSAKWWHWTVASWFSRLHQLYCPCGHAWLAIFICLCCLLTSECALCTVAPKRAPLGSPLWNLPPSSLLFSAPVILKKLDRCTSREWNECRDTDVPTVPYLFLIVQDFDLLLAQIGQWYNLFLWQVLQSLGASILWHESRPLLHHFRCHILKSCTFLFFALC